MVSSAAAAMVKTAMDSTAAEKTDSKPAAEVETTLPVRLRPKKLSLSSEGRQGARQLLPNAPGARARQDHVAHIEQVSWGGGYFTCRFASDGSRWWCWLRKDQDALAHAQLAKSIDGAMPTRGRTGGGMSLR